MTTGAYAGVLIDQPANNTHALTFSGNGVLGIHGTVYAPAAAAALSGNSQTSCSLVVNSLTVSGNTVFNQLTSADGQTVYSPDQIRTAYGMNNLALDGTGQTIALVEAYDNPNIYQSLDTFDLQFGATTGGATLFAQY